ncbi:hypothetical protein GCM10007874_40240 [Labrys miyagiensis]|uniref:Phasin protein n=1 Tax=Labrys miyagiensis TaxID=346912 RepID=A0ABQ6CMY6_9HYPH|nr:hypothetical protein GCM10007874_40240 [Labrys miyagiensis]
MLAHRNDATRARFSDLTRQFMANHARIFEKGVASLEDVQIRTANAGTADADKNLAGAWRRPRTFL